MKQKGKEWQDHKGNIVPKYAINPVLQIEEKHAQRIADKAQFASRHLKDLVQLCRDAYKDVYAAKLADAKIKDKTNTPSEGHMLISAFDGTVSVRLTKPETLYFDTTYVSLVQQKFDEYFTEAFSDADEKSLFLRQLVSDLLKTSGGNLDQNKVLQLRKYRAGMSDILAKNPNSPVRHFVEAVDLMDKAIKTKPGTMGIYIEVRNEETGKMERLPLKYTDY